MGSLNVSAPAICTNVSFTNNLLKSSTLDTSQSPIWIVKRNVRDTSVAVTRLWKNTIKDSLHHHSRLGLGKSRWLCNFGQGTPGLQFWARHLLWKDASLTWMHRMYDWRHRLYFRDYKNAPLRHCYYRAPQERSHFVDDSNLVCYGWRYSRLHVLVPSLPPTRPKWGGGNSVRFHKTDNWLESFPAPTSSVVKLTWLNVLVSPSTA